MARRILIVISIAIIFVLTLSGCAKDKNSKSLNGGRKISESSSTSKSSNSISTERKKDFQSQVQDVCNSVDSKVFETIIGVDPKIDSEFEKKFQDADDALKTLHRDFSAIKAPKSKQVAWHEALESLETLQVLVKKVSDQYVEYIALLEESKVNEDPVRSFQIITRLLALGQEYFQTLDTISLKFKDMVQLGSLAGVPKCAAFGIE